MVRFVQRSRGYIEMKKNLFVSCALICLLAGCGEESDRTTPELGRGAGTIDDSAVTVGSLVPVDDEEMRAAFEGHWKLKPGQSLHPPRQVPLEMQVDHAVIVRVRVPDDPAYEAVSQVRYRLYFDDDQKNYLVRAAPLDWGGALDADAFTMIDELQFTDDRDIIKIRCEYPPEGKNGQRWWVYRRQREATTE